MLADRGFEVPVVLMTPAELSATYAEALEVAEVVARDWVGQGHLIRSHYVTLLAEPATGEAILRLEARSGPGEQVRVGRRAVHLLLDKPYHEARTGNAEVERGLGVATTRNLSVITKLADKWGR